MIFLHIELANKSHIDSWILYLDPLAYPQSSKKLGSWDLGSRTLFRRNPDIFGKGQKSTHLFSCRKWNIIWWELSIKSFKTIFINKFIFICELFTEIWKSDIFISWFGSQTFFVFLELCIPLHIKAKILQSCLMCKLCRII
jgi:hypothetical protein